MSLTPKVLYVVYVANEIHGGVDAELWYGPQYRNQKERPYLEAYEIRQEDIGKSHTIESFTMMYPYKGQQKIMDHSNASTTSLEERIAIANEIYYNKIIQLLKEYSTNLSSNVTQIFMQIESRISDMESKIGRKPYE